MIIIHPSPLIDDENFEVVRVVARRVFRPRREKVRKNRAYLVP
jgi:hypothetical protein